MPPLLLVMTGGAIGAALRYEVGRLMLRILGPAWPWGTLTVNLAGGFLMGLLAGWLAARAQGGEAIRLFVAVGIMGGFTTFSAFSLETWLMIERGEMVPAFAYVAASVIGAVGALGLGLLTMRSLAA